MLLRLGVAPRDARELVRVGAQVAVDEAGVENEEAGAVEVRWAGPSSSCAEPSSGGAASMVEGVVPSALCSSRKSELLKSAKCAAPSSL
eukprot:4762110-Pyramimonas_sp.AAC.1